MKKSTITIASVKIIQLLNFLLLSFMIYKSPLRLDDLTWGGKIGIDRLKNLFSNYNGRYAGNLTVILLTRLPKIIRAGIMSAIILVFLYAVYRLLNRNKKAICFFSVLFFCMPLSIFTQTVTWTAGFSNYFVSIMMIMIIIMIDLNIVSSNERISNPFVVGFLTFIGQLFLETTTIYIVALSFALLFFQKFRKKAIPKALIWQLFAALLGAGLMFSNEAYLSAFLHDGGTYKSISGGSFHDLILSVVTTYKNTVSKKWFGINTFFNLSFSILLTYYCIFQRNKYKNLFVLIGALFIATFIYDIIDGDKTIILTTTICALISVLFIIYIVLIVFYFVRSEKRFWFIFLIASNILLMLPLNIVTPINDRCFLSTYTFWSLLFISFFELFQEEIDVKFNIFEINQILNMILLVYLICSIFSQALSWQIEEMRMNAINGWKQTKEAELVLPAVPDAGLYCYGANLSGDYWLGNYKAYYGIDSSVKLSFIDYKKYIGGS